MATVLAILIFHGGSIVGAGGSFIGGFCFADWLNEWQERARYLNDRRQSRPILSLFPTMPGL